MQNTDKQVWPGSNRLRVLIADDNHDAADSLAFLVRIWGHDARVTYDGAAALAEARTFQPQVAFLDIGMPKLDGYQLCRKIRRDGRLAEMILVALTAYSDDDALLQAQEAGFDGHLVKPVEPARIQTLLGQARAPVPVQATRNGQESSGEFREINFPTSFRKPFHSTSRIRAVSASFRRAVR